MKYVLILIMALTACGPAKHLQLAKYHIDKAVKKGADVASDTIKKKITFKLEGANTSFNLGPTILQQKDGVINKYILKDTIIYKDKIRTEIKNNTVYVECPDDEVTKDVPVAVNTEIKAGYTKFQYITAVIGGLLFGVIIGFVVGKVIKVG